MKKVFTILFLLGILSLNSYSQSFTFQRIGPTVAIGDTVLGAVCKAVLKNISTSTLGFKYVRTLNNLPGPTWTCSMCGAGNCFAPTVDTVPPSFIHSPFELGPGASDTFYVDVSGKSLGIATIVVKAFVTSNPAVFIADTFKVQLIDHIGIKQINEIVKDYNLKQNYPNPFNPTTSIDFSLPEKTNLSLTIYNVAGREVAKLLNNQSLNSGSYKYDFNADDYGLSSGIYFYELKTDKYQKTLKMVLIK